MSPLLIVLIVMIIGLPIAWLSSEFQDRRWLRIALGLSALLMSFGVAALVGALYQLNYNAWYGSASSELVEATVTELEAGRVEHVIAELQEFVAHYEPTYENRANYNTLAKETAARIRGDAPEVVGAPADDAASEPAGQPGRTDADRSSVPSKTR